MGPTPIAVNNKTDNIDTGNKDVGNKDLEKPSDDDLDKLYGVYD